MSFSPRFQICAAAAAIALCTTLGCQVTTPRPEKMIASPDEVSVGRSFPHSVVVVTDPSVRAADEGGYGKPIQREDFVEAVAASLEKIDLFSGVSREGAADLRLFVTVFDIDFPEFGIANRCTVSAEWKLVRDDGSDEVLLHEAIAAYGNVGFHMAGITMATMSRELAGRNNVAEGLRRLAELDL